MELRPFRAIRFSPEAFPDAAIRIAELTQPGQDPAAASVRLKEWMDGGILWKERRPGMWQYVQTEERAGTPRVVRMLVGVVRVEPKGDVVITGPEEDPSEERRGLLGGLRADFEPALVATRAPLTAALMTTRRPDHTVADGGRRHDLLRITDYAEHVELQGLVKNAEATLRDGRAGWDAARALSQDPAAAKLPGAKYKLCAIVEENELADRPEPLRLAAGFFGFSVEDPVY